MPHISSRLLFPLLMVVLAFGCMVASADEPADEAAVGLDFPDDREVAPRMRLDGLPEYAEETGFVVREMPAIAADGQRVLYVFEDEDGGRGYPHYEVMVTDVETCERSSRLTLVTPEEIEAVEKADDDFQVIRARIRKRLEEADTLFSDTEWYSPGIEIPLLILREDVGRNMDAILQVPSEPGLVFHYSYGGFDVTSPEDALWNHRVPLCNVVYPDEGLKNPDEEPDCDNEPYLIKAWWEPTTRRIIAEFGFTGSDFCWEPGPMLAVGTLPDGEVAPWDAFENHKADPSRAATLDLPPFQLEARSKEESLENAEKARTANAEAVTHARAGRVAKAEARYRRAIELDPSLALARSNYAALLAAAGREDEALLLLEELAEMASVCPHCAHLVVRAPGDADFNALVDDERFSQAVQKAGEHYEFSEYGPEWRYEIDGVATGLVNEHLTGLQTGIEMTLAAGFPLGILRRGKPDEVVLLGEADDIASAIPVIKLENKDPGEGLDYPRLDCQWRCCAIEWTRYNRSTKKQSSDVCSMAGDDAELPVEICARPLGEVAVPTTIQYATCDEILSEAR